MSLTQEKKVSAEILHSGYANSGAAGDARFVNKDGTANVIRSGLNPLQRFSIYHYMLKLQNWKFFLLIVLFYTSINFIFAFIYFLIGTDKLHGLIHGTTFENFEEAYFFSAQTLTTVGYGRISPVGMLANTVSALEALIGIMTLAIITGLLYGRFVNPTAFIKYSHHALIAPFREGNALMFRLAPTKNSTLSEVQATVTLTMLGDDNGTTKMKFFVLPLELEKIMSLSLSWTVVHAINEDSPLYNFSREDVDRSRVQIIVYLKAFDEGFSNTVVSRTSYAWNEVVYGAKFKPMFGPSENNKSFLIELDKIDDYEAATLH